MTLLMGLEVEGRDVLVAGGGPVAARRAAALAGQGARVTVVAPQLCEDLVDLVAAAQARWVDREVREADVEGAWLVHAATDDPRVNEEVCRWATERRTWSVNAGGASAGTARTPATTSAGGLAVGVVSTGSPDPGRAAAVRDQLATVLHEGALDLRARRRRAGPGRVVLVGGGPGAEDLMTVRARRALAEADVVVTDRLGPVTALARLPETVEVIDVGKAPGRHSVPQDEINRIIVEQAQRGRTVVRLKGGDPFLFGRGGEEAIACRAHGIPVEVVPGVSSAIAAPAAAGVPVTHRGTSASVHITHGHGPLSPQAIHCVVRGSATLVLLMGVSTLAEHVAQLLAAGASADTPVAIVERATLESERTTRATLATVVGAAQEAAVEAPAVIVIGATAAEGLLEGSAANPGACG
ncbi:MAG TPA: uroporphyrinogen-III C-methyltransferase [Pedococcus sp.]|jgi:uroporphyrin-III C-methyltransferase/precorrin-2 dehydrogenase/sirohydrochlorin ferrochelatase|uniref:uroporphyrinogen-III C-methyltransferase n=1 Tax=Pedococcus sp. TaxID=2860345 RepID=UPI002F9574CB